MRTSKGAAPVMAERHHISLSFYLGAALVGIAWLISLAIASDGPGFVPRPHSDCAVVKR